MISHKNVCAVASNSEARVKISHDDVYLSYLPMAHVMERTTFNAMIHHSVKIGVYAGNPLKLTEDLQILKPTLFVTVPRLFNKIYDKIINAVQDKPKIM